MAEIEVKKTYGVTTGEWEEIVDGFNEEFKKDKNAAGLIQYYSANFCGYSYHGIARDKSGALAGFSSIVPAQYTDAAGKIFLTGLSGGSFVKKEFRNDIFIFHDIYKALRVACAADGYKLVLGVPNKNSFKYLVKLAGFRFLYNLPYFVLPLRIKNIFSNRLLKIFSRIYYALIWLYVKLVYLFSFLYNPKEKKQPFNIYYSENDYALRFGNSYNNIKRGSFSFTYKVYNEKNINTAYLFDFRQDGQRTLRALCKAVNYILMDKQADIIAFVGKLDMQQSLLLHLPGKKEPQQLPLTIDVLIPGSDPENQEFNQPDNWNFALMNFDIR